MSGVSRRELLKTAGSAIAARPAVRAMGGAPVLALRQNAPVPNPHGKLGLGGAPTGFGARSRANAAAAPPVDFIDWCHSIGLGGAEVRLPPTDPAEIAKLRARLESYQMRVTFDFPLPKSDAEAPQFDTLVRRRATSAPPGSAPR